jgi:hypothetical protein
MEAPVLRTNYPSDGDALVLEDESGRVLLAAGQLPNGADFPLARLTRTLVTGVVIAVRGRVLENGALAVVDVVGAFAEEGSSTTCPERHDFPFLTPPLPLPSPSQWRAFHCCPTPQVGWGPQLWRPRPPLQPLPRAPRPPTRC